MTQPTARQILHAELMAGEDPDSDVYADSETRINGLIDAHRDEVRRELLGDDSNPSNLVLDAAAFRYLADGIAATMADQNEWDGDAAEEAILLRYVQHLAKGLDDVLAEAADQLPPWEASYDSATFTPRLLAYCNDEVAAKGAAEAWLHSQVEDATGLEWTPDPQMAVGEWDQWFELVRDNPYGDGVVATEIVVRRLVARTAQTPQET